MESMKMKLFAAVAVMLMAVSAVSAQDAPAAAPGPAMSDAGVFVPTAVASLVAIAFGLVMILINHKLTIAEYKMQ
ncbi:hypothetical protein L1987_86638 [Smallanthus sonchifolius]|uniref:Uncharacterized protein n=1 Tax=Smallanthus sonchifolius TaxID=185202 RepID=A0ACB8Y138_9ASTR|nr:hypothetical protein L1987_86638 [Smallanthus sonchifolius]